MKRKILLFLTLLVGSALIAACAGNALPTLPAPRTPFSPTNTPTATPSPTPTQPPPPPTEIAIDLPQGAGAAAKAVDLLAAWVDAGAPETDPFDYIGVDGNSYQGLFAVDILPLFTESDLWYEGAQACTGCHFANSEASYHEMDLSTYEGIMLGGDVLSAPPGTPILGQSAIGATDYDWAHSKLRARLRDNRMPPGWEFDITETNRDGLCVEASNDGVTILPGEYGCELNGVSLIAAWVEAGAPETDAFDYGGAALNFERDVLPFFTEADMWYEGSQACTGCHFANSEASYHEMDMSTYEGIMLGGDVLSSPPGTPILGQSAIGETDYDWSHSKLRDRLRNNRMPPGIEFDITEENRDGPFVLHGRLATEPPPPPPQETAGESGPSLQEMCAVKAVSLLGAWVNAGAPETAPFGYLSDAGNACGGTFEADVLPLFTENNVWYEGAQACTGCHFGNTENSYHEMDLSTYAGILSGADVLSSPPGVPMLGQSAVGETDYDWDHSKLRARLRNNRMPPGWEFDITETNRDGLCVEVSADGVAILPGEYGCELNGVGLIAAWVEAGAPETDAFDYGDTALTFERDVLPFFTEEGMWFEGSQACTGCHFANSETSYHEMDMSSYAGIMLGGDVLSAPPGVPILGQSEVGATDYDWAASKLRERLRNNRMPPGIAFDITEENRDGPIILAGKKK